jgi:hypothetical protein
MSIYALIWLAGSGIEKNYEFLAPAMKMMLLLADPDPALPH